MKMAWYASTTSMNYFPYYAKLAELTQLKMDGKDLRMIKNMYWEKTGALRIHGEIGH